MNEDVLSRYPLFLDKSARVCPALVAKSSPTSPAYESIHPVYTSIAAATIPRRGERIINGWRNVGRLVDVNAALALLANTAIVSNMARTNDAAMIVPSS